MAASLFSQPPIAYFQPLESPPTACTPSFIACETSDCSAFGGSSFTEFETISSKVCGWAGELGKDHDLRQKSDPCTWLFSEQAAPFPIGAELPTSTLIPAAQRQPRVDFISSAAAMKNIFRAACDEESDVGVMVHRLGDWLVMDDGTEISEFLADSTLVVEGGFSPQFVNDRSAQHDRGPNAAETAPRQPSLAERAAEQRHRAAVARAEMAKARAADAQQRLEMAWATLRQVEAETQKAQELLLEAASEVSRALEELEVHQRQRTASATPRTSDTTDVASARRRPAQPDAPDIDSCLHSLDIEVDAPEELQLYQNLLGHSVLRALHDDTAAPKAAPSPAAASSSPHAGELLALDGAPVFRQVGVWKIADDASVVIGSRMLCLGNAEHPKLTVYLHHQTVLSDMLLLEHCIECLIAGVPEFAICLHRDGAVQSYTLYKLSELWNFLEERLGIAKKLRMTLEALRWIRRQCSLEGCTYWLSKAKSEPTLKLFKLCSTSAQKPVATCEPQSPAQVVPPNQAADLVLKNTFWHIVTAAEAEASDFRRSQSCPARVYGPAPLDDDYTAEEESTPTSPTHAGSRPLEPLRGRVSALFFRRGISSAPDSNASRFFHMALDFESQWDCNSAASGGRTDAQQGERLLLQSWCHLGLALCEISFSCTDREESRADVLLSALRADALSYQRSAHGVGKYALAPLGNVRRHLPLLGIGLLPWPSGLQAAVTPTTSSVSPPSLTALRYAVDAISLLSAVPCGASSSAHRDRKGVEAVAFPLMALALLNVASELAARLSSLPTKSDVPKAVSFAGLAWRCLAAARQFAALAASHQPPKVQPFFAGIPSAQELLIRIEHLCGGLLLVCAWEHLPVTSITDVADLIPELWFVELQRRLTKLELWLRLDPPRLAAAVETLCLQLGPSSDLDDTLGDEVVKAIFGTPLTDRPLPPQRRWRLQAAWHYERSIRFLPKAIRGGSLLNQLMLALSAALVELVASLTEGINAHAFDEYLPDDGERGAVGNASRTVARVLQGDKYLDRAENLAEAAGHPAKASLIQASRGHLRSLVADILVRMSLESEADLRGTSLDVAQLESLRELCIDDSDDEDFTEEECGDSPVDRSATVEQMIGRLGDLGADLVLSAQQAVDNVIDPEVAVVLSAMSSGVLQAGAARLWMLPPRGVPEAECRRTAMTLLTRSLQFLPSTQHGSGQCQVLHEAHLSAHAHLLQAEILLEGRGAGSCTEKPQQKHQRVAWHIERARLALHGAGSSGIIACVFLVDSHLIQARLCGQGSSAPRRQAEQALEELVAGCRALSAAPCCEDEAPAIRTAHDESCKLLLQRLQAVVRALCAREGGKRDQALDAEMLGRYKELYRSVLQLPYTEVMSFSALHDAFCNQESQ